MLKKTLHNRLKEALALHCQKIEPEQAKVKGQILLNAGNSENVDVLKKIGSVLLEFDEVQTIKLSKDTQKAINDLLLTKRGAKVMNKSSESPAKKRDSGLGKLEIKKLPKGILTAKQLLQKPFNPVPVKEKWKKIIGDFEMPTHFLLSGEGGCGKSGMALEYARDMSEMGYKVLYASKEQFDSPTFPALLRAVQIDLNDTSIHFSRDYETLDYNPGNYDWVILDSKDSFEIHNPRDFERLTDKYPNTSFIIMSQSLKDGKFTGAGQWRNVVDTMLEAYQRGKMRTGEKNRWDQFGEVTLFETETEKKA